MSSTRYTLALAEAQASGSTRIDHGGARWYLGHVQQIPTMTTNPWINRIAAIALLAMVYVAGVDSGIKAQHNQPACQERVN